jgi:soluble lytic murein transglycosylase
LDTSRSVYGGLERPLAAAWARAGTVALLAAALVAAASSAGARTLEAKAPAKAKATAVAADPIVQAREAWGRKDAARLAAARDEALAARHPLAMWVDYWALNQRLQQATQAELDAFYARWSGTYVEDRLRNDWLLELGRRRDWANFAVDHPRFRMNDDREVACYALLVRHQGGHDVREAARAAWFAQRDADDGCALLAATLLDARVLAPADAWRKARLAMDAGRVRAARQAVALTSLAAATQVQELADSPSRYLARKAGTGSRLQAELTTLALMRLASSDPDSAATALSDPWEKALPADLATWAWMAVARHAAMKLSPEAPDHFERAARLAPAGAAEPDWGDDAMAWKARAALRAEDGRGRWAQVVQAVDAMPARDRADATWVYWKARALQSLADEAAARPGAAAPGSGSAAAAASGAAPSDAPAADAETVHAEARAMLASIAGQLSFYGALAAEALGQPLALPAAPADLTTEEHAAAADHPGLARALQMATLGLRDESRREWNFSLRGMGDRELLAAAALACAQQDWQLCINTSERTKSEIDLAQRYPTPYRRAIAERARELGLDVPYVMGLIRQETRFMATLRSHAGASGLMQVMPATARWTARKIGLDFKPHMIDDPETNLRLGTGYLKLVLDAFDGSQPLAAAAYNAGPNRPRRWREGPSLDSAAWAENIPFSETRDYVKKVLANATVYAALLNGERPALRARLGRLVGPREAAAEVGTDLP